MAFPPAKKKGNPFAKKYAGGKKPNKADKMKIMSAAKNRQMKNC